MTEFTGGPLNLLNGKMGISNPYKSVPVMALIRKHNPKSRQELLDLISDHFINDCYCGIKSTGTVEDFGNRLFNSQIEYWGEIRYSLKECIQWEYDLFIVQSLKGQRMENKAQKLLEDSLKEYTITEVDEYLDSEYRIDLLIKKNNNVICGIQVKPSSFNQVREEVIYYQKMRNKEWEHPVFTLLYNQQSEFYNIEKILGNINSIK